MKVGKFVSELMKYPEMQNSGLSYFSLLDDEVDGETDCCHWLSVKVEVPKNESFDLKFYFEGFSDTLKLF